MADDLRKIELSAQLAAARARLSADVKKVGRQLDVPTQMKSSFLHHKKTWLGSAAMLGWVLARLPARKKKVKVYVDGKSDRKLKEVKEAGLALMLTKLLFSAVKPAVMAFATKKITDYVARDTTSNHVQKHGLR